MAYLGRYKAFQKFRKRAGMVGDPGLLKNLGKVLKKVVPAVASFIPGGGLVKGAVGLVSGIAKKVQDIKKVGLITFDAKEAARAATMRGGLFPSRGGVMGSKPGLGFIDPSIMGPSASDWQRAQDMMRNSGIVTGGVPMGAPGFRKRYRRMNPMNPRAANRAIRRIKSVRKILRSIESSLPKQRATATRRK